MAEYYREHHLQRKYGITQQDYNDMLQAQNNWCAICNIEEQHCENSRLAVDHDHDTGLVRALLCKKCNQAIGLLQDNSSFAYKAFEYLKEHNK
jgi:predicted nucleic acid-binding protein